MHGVRLPLGQMEDPQKTPSEVDSSRERKKDSALGWSIMIPAERDKIGSAWKRVTAALQVSGREYWAAAALRRRRQGGEQSDASQTHPRTNFTWWLSRAPWWKLHSGGAENYCGYYGEDGRRTRAKVEGVRGVGGGWRTVPVINSTSATTWTPSEWFASVIKNGSFSVRRWKGLGGDNW